MKTKHTPGPWKIKEKLHDDGYLYAYAVGSKEEPDIAKVAAWGAMPQAVRDTALANARLIAAAPEMADALIETCEACEKTVCGGCSVGRALHKAGIILELWDGLAVEDERSLLTS